ncbi:MAG: hypothetical protein ACOCSH_02225 [Candidatus Hadarchaeota archaeon]
MEVRDSGPLKVAAFDCYSCEGCGSLASSECCACVLQNLSVKEEVDRVVLRGAFNRIYQTGKISELAKFLARLKTEALDKSFYLSETKKDRCGDCVDRRYKKVEGVWTEFLENFEDLSVFDRLKESEMKSGGCAKCSEENFFPLLERIKKSIEESDLYQELRKTGFEGNEDFRVQPFFVKSLWGDLYSESKEILDSYDLPNDRGLVRIHRQNGRPVPYYELEIPEFDISKEEANLLYEAYRMEISTAPDHARFARPSRMPGFAEEWYRALLQIVEQKSEYEISNSRLCELAEMISKWLAYGILEPLSHDENITDIYIEAPPELQTVRVVHRKWGSCDTGIRWSSPSLLGISERLASKLGRSFDEPNPQLDVEIPELGLRLFISRFPAIWTRNSCAAAVRRRRDKPWTQPLFIDEGSITPLASSLVGNLIRKGASIFTIGDIGTAKTSYLITLIPEIGSGERIIAFQDTEELQFEDFIREGYELENVRISDSNHLQSQIDAFLRGGAAYWLITEVRSLKAVKSALAAAARRGSQPILSTFHAKTKRQMFDLICNIMGLDEAAFKNVDFIVRTSKFESSSGTVRRVTEISEILKHWTNDPEYVTLFSDDRKEDFLKPENVLYGPEDLIRRVNSEDLREIDPFVMADSLDFLPSEEGGSKFIPRICDQFALDKRDFLIRILFEAKMKSELLMLAREIGDRRYLELSFVSDCYGEYFSLMSEYAPDYDSGFSEWREWLEGNI